MSNAMARPWIEIRREITASTYRSYACVYRSPLRLFVRGRWLIGDPAKETKR